jgi:inosine-uridine nucleoside N-ribohydrolase
MPRKVILVADPGIDTSFAIALALHDPSLEVIGLLPTAGNVNATQAQANIQRLISEFDPKKWPRSGTALPVTYEMDGTALHGPDGLGGLNLPLTERHTHHVADRVLCELVRQHPREVTVLCLGPATTLATAMTRDPEIAGLMDRVILVGGCWREPGNAGPVTEFHFALDPESARQILRSSVHAVVLPLDVTRKLTFSPTELLELPNPESRTCQFLRQIVPYGIRASMQLHGMEGMHLKDVVGVAMLALPGAVTLEERILDIETRGELTRGMLIVDSRNQPHPRPNGFLGVDLAVGEVHQWIARTLRNAP